MKLATAAFHPQHALLNPIPQAQIGRRRGSAPERAARAARSARPRPQSLPGAILDEARDKVSRKIQALVAFLRPTLKGTARTAAESELKEMEYRLQAIAGAHKARCRSGNFEQIDLAIYLRHASRLTSAQPPADEGGFEFAPDRSLTWSEGDEDRADLLRGMDLEAAVDLAELPHQAFVRGAVYACAIVAPPWAFRWRKRPSSAGRDLLASDPRDVYLRVFADDHGVSVELTLAEQGPGLPEIFDHELQSVLGEQIRAVLRDIARVGPDTRTDVRVDFRVSFTGTQAQGGACNSGS